MSSVFQHAVPALLFTLKFVFQKQTVQALQTEFF